VFHVAECNNSINQTVTEERVTRFFQDYSLGLLKKKKNIYFLFSCSLSISEKLYFCFET